MNTTTPGMRIDEIRVIDRHRTDFGDLNALVESIRELSLLQPVVVTRDGRLVAGQRRLAACRSLGWEAIPVAYAENLTDAVELLKAERDENVCRKAMVPSELAALGEALHAFEAQNAKERQRQAGREHGRGIASDPKGTSYSGNKTRALVGQALGMAGSTYSDLRSAYRLASDTEAPDAEREIARDALKEMDRTGHVKPVVERMRKRLRNQRGVEERKQPKPPKAEPSQESTEAGEWIPPKGDSSQKAAARRRDLIQELARRGYSSEQIGDRIGMRPETVRRIAREERTSISADEALRKTHRKIDSNRIIRETVAGFEGLELALSLVDFDALDTYEIPNWTASLSEAIRILNRLNKQLKEMVQ
jgi:ParB family chromosome partitioning protein